jgi:hypothetical protein
MPTRRRTARRRRNPDAADAVIAHLRTALRALESAVYASSDLRDEASLEEAGMTFAAGSLESDISRLYDATETAIFAAEEIAEAAEAIEKERDERQNPRRRRTARRPMRRNSMGADAMYYALQKKRIPWGQMTRAQIEAVVQDAAQHGDADLVRRARAALARRHR